MNFITRFIRKIWRWNFPPLFWNFKFSFRVVHEVTTQPNRSPLCCDIYLHRANQLHGLKFFVRDGNIKYEAKHVVTL